MKVTGFTFIRNAIKFDYPIAEAIRSILPVCDDFVVAVGNSGDNTEELVRNIDRNKIKIINTIWDDSPEMKTGGKVFAAETNKAFRAVPDDSDWAFYIQGDEAVHEKYLDTIHSAMLKWKDNLEVDGLLFNYLHFYGSYDYVATSPRWYSNEIRVIRNDKSVWSYRDAQGFRKGDNKKLNVKPVDAYIYHYGWVKEPEVMMRKVKNATSFYTGGKVEEEDGMSEKFNRLNELNRLRTSERFDYSKIDALSRFDGTHPAVMQEHIERKNWSFDHDMSYNRLSLRYRGKIFIRKYLGIDTFYKNYKLI